MEAAIEGWRDSGRRWKQVVVDEWSHAEQVVKLEMEEVKCMDAAVEVVEAGGGMGE